MKDTLTEQRTKFVFVFGSRDAEDLFDAGHDQSLQGAVEHRLY
jgi:hypothetical protein